MANIVELTDRFPVNNKTIKAGKKRILKEMCLQDKQPKLNIIVK